MTMVQNSISHIAYLQCSACDRNFPVQQVNTFATCNTCGKSPLLSVYDFPPALQRDVIDTQERSMWRYYKMLPVRDKKNIVTLGEGWTPLLKVERLANTLGVDSLMMKDESQNPTGSFKARGLSAAVSKAKELGIENCIIATAGNAGGAMAAYCARAGITATVVMPVHTPRAFKTECHYLGATVVEVNGLISDCATTVATMNRDGIYFDLSTLKEPYRLEGKKTMGYEIAEQLNWQLPEVILYPTGGGTGLIGMWRAFIEMMHLGWIQKKMPRFIAVQSDNCKPVVNAFLNRPATTPATATIANGLAVPFPFAHKLIQQVLHETAGSAIAVPEKSIIPCVKEIATTEGMLISPEGAALLAALKTLLQNGEVKRTDRILLLNTGSGYKYIESFF